MSSRHTRITAALIAVTAGAGALAAAPLLAQDGGHGGHHPQGPPAAPAAPAAAPAAPAAPAAGQQQGPGAQKIGIGVTQQPGQQGDPQQGAAQPGDQGAQGNPGAQGGWGRGRGRSFTVSCDFVKSGMFDPIVFPGQEPAGHMHQFFGNTGIAPGSTTATLVSGNANGDATSCDVATDGSAYWVPALMQDGTEVMPDQADLQYRAIRGQRRVRAFPAGLTMIAGDKTATTLQAHAGWRCEFDAPGTALSAEVPTCATDEDIVGVVTFPSCWDGKNLSSSDQSHMAYAVAGGCPDTNPVPVPELRMATYWPSAGSGHTYSLSMGGMSAAGLHADFMNGWDQTALRRQVRRWLNRR